MTQHSTQADPQPDRINDHTYRVSANGSMRVPLRVITDDDLMAAIKEDKALIQGCHVAALPGIVGEALMMPDAHQGYGFPIGGVAATDEHNGCLSPGGVGFDINCGMRLLTTGLSFADAQPYMDAIMDGIYAAVPVGIGRDSSLRLDHSDLDQIAVRGAEWALEHGLANQDDLDATEESGRMDGADPGCVSPRAKKRGRGQIGTLGAGNHFIELQRISEVFDAEKARTYGLDDPDALVVMIHCGSRGYGHQICTDYLRRIEETYPELIDSLPERDLAYAPADSDVARDYVAAMACAMNFAWCNRQVITHRIRRVFEEVFEGRATVRTVYDMSHNNAKLEEHDVDGHPRRVWVHRKGAARAFPPGHMDVPEQYRDAGQPVLIPGSMGTASYVLAGTAEAMRISFGTTCHGAGRKMSRRKAQELFDEAGVRRQLDAASVRLKARSAHGIVHEAPGVYKDIHAIIDVCRRAGIAVPVVKLIPVGVIKG